MPTDGYWIKRNSKVIGPITGQQVKKSVLDGKILKTDLISSDNSNWIPAEKVAGLFPKPVQSYADSELELLAQERSDATPQVIPIGNSGSASNVPSPKNEISCPKCGSTQFHASKDGYGGGKGCCGWLLLGPLGILCGFCGSRNVSVTCLRCGHRWNPAKRR